MNTDYDELVDSHKFPLITVLLFAILITIVTHFGIVLFRKKYRRELISISGSGATANSVPIATETTNFADNELIKNQRAEKLEAIIQMAMKNDDAFFLKFNEFDSDFRKSLLRIAPGLVSSELEFCALLKLNFDTKEIARFTATSVRAVEGRKYRIRKKLNIGSKEDINIFMVNV